VLPSPKDSPLEASPEEVSVVSVVSVESVEESPELLVESDEVVSVPLLELSVDEPVVESEEDESVEESVDVVAAVVDASDEVYKFLLESLPPSTSQEAIVELEWKT